jgi:signal peptidase I
MRQGDSTPADIAAAVKCDLAGEVLRAFGSGRFPAVGWSMLPAVWPGDTLVVERTPEEARVGDIVVVGRDGKLCGHRVVSIGGEPGNPQWITQGDALPVPDRPVRRSELLGRVAYVIRAGERVAVPAKLSVVERLIAGIVRRCVLAGRALVYLRRMIRTSMVRTSLVRTSEKSGPKESIFLCH